MTKNMIRELAPEELQPTCMKDLQELINTSTKGFSEIIIEYMNNLVELGPIGSFEINELVGFAIVEARDQHGTIMELVIKRK